MLFLIRCTFWLSIVFYSMPWPQQSQTGQGAGLRTQVMTAAAGLAGDLAAGGGSMVQAKLEESCAKADCRASAVKLLQMVASEAAPEPTPPKRPGRLAESETGRQPVLHKSATQRN